MLSSVTAAATAAAAADDLKSVKGKKSCVYIIYNICITKIPAVGEKKVVPLSTGHPEMNYSNSN